MNWPSGVVIHQSCEFWWPCESAPRGGSASSAGEIEFVHWAR